MAADRPTLGIFARWDGCGLIGELSLYQGRGWWKGQLKAEPAETVPRYEGNSLRPQQESNLQPTD